MTPENLSPDELLRLLKDSEIRFRGLFEQAPLSLQIFSAEGILLEYNVATERLWGGPKPELRAMVIGRYNVLADVQLEKKGVLAYLKKAFEGQLTQLPALLYDPAESGQIGRPRWLESLAYPIVDQGAVREVVIAHNDVTERVEREQLLERQTAELREVVRARDEFLSIASHELKTPLTALRLQVQMQERKLDGTDGKGPAVFDRESMQKFVLSTAKQVDRLVKLVDDMLDISKIAHGKLEVEPVEMDLGTVVREVVDRFSEQLTEVGCTYQITADRGIVGRWDRTRIEQVVSNLLTNAIKYGGNKPIEISVHAHHGKAVLSVRDQGIGIVKESQERIFERFERAVPAVHISGLGLGLYISRKIVEAHNGSISVKSELGVGSTFTVELPLTVTA